MHASEYDLMRLVEDHHWWHRVLRNQVLNALATRLPPRGTLLDAGCGTGGMLECLREQHSGVEIEGIDASPLAVQHCRRRGLTQVRQGTVNELSFAEEAFDVVLSLDVIYHAGVDEQKALEEMSRVLRPEGVLVTNVPAFACLRGAHDVAVEGVRRYTKGHVRDLLGEHGLSCEKIYYWNAWLFLPLLVWRKLSRRSTEEDSVITSDLAPPPKWLNRVLAFVGKVDAQLCRALHLPFGSSVFAVARKIKGEMGGLAA